MGLTHAESLSHIDERGLRAHPTSALDIVRAYFTLTKPRIVLLLLFTGYCAMIVARGALPSLRQTLFGLGGLALSAGGSAVINMWYDRDIDVVMERTAKRPIPSGLVKPNHALMFGIGLGVASVALLLVCVNWLSAVLSLLGYIYYACVYTMGLKRRTAQNIVIGGGAGAFPPLVGWAVVTGHLSLVAWLMFAVIFLWTPSHFWGLALYKNEDYTRAGVPMMPVVRGARATKIQMVLYAVLLLAVSMMLASLLKASMLYTLFSALIGVLFLCVNVRLLRSPDDNFHWAKKTFFGSLVYLPVLFTTMVVCALV